MVMIIIGLLGGSILVGRSLIHIAEVRSQVKQIEELNAAVVTFMSKYDCLPGDCAHAEESGLSANGRGANGDGDGYITSDVGQFRNVIRGPEIYNFWYHLFKAQLVDKEYPIGGLPGVHSPPLKMKGQGLPNALTGAGVVAVSNQTGGIWLLPKVKALQLTYPLKVDSWVLTSRIYWRDAYGVYMPEDAFMLDTKLDDGKPLTGIMTAISGYGYGLWSQCNFLSTVPAERECRGYSPVTTEAFTDPNACVNDSDGEAVYNVKTSVRSEHALCAPVIRAAFAKSK